MPQVNPEFIDAVDDVVEDKDPRAEWEEDEMRSALMDVQKGSSMEKAAEGRDLSAGGISRVMGKVEEREEELIAAREQGSGLFRDPVDEAVDSFRGFFEDMNEKYEMGINNVTIEMMVDEIRDAGQLPRPNYVAQFIDTTNSGVGNQGDIRYITRRYRQWLDNFKQQQGQSMGDGIGDGIGGADVSGGGQAPASGGSGVDVTGQQGLFPGEQQSAQQESNDRVDRLEREISELKDLIREDSQTTGPEGRITIEREDGPNVTVPANHPAVQQMVGDGAGSDSPDFMEMLQQAKEAGLVVGSEEMRRMQDSGSDFDEMLERLQSLGVVDTGSGDEMASAIRSAIQNLGQQQLQAQQQMSENMTQVMEDIREMQQEDDEDISLSDVEEVIDQKLTKSETERLREEMDSKFEQVMEKVEERRSRRRGGKNDPEVLKTDREMDFRETQLETLNENVKALPGEVAAAINEAVPAIKQLQEGNGSAGSPLWDPPESTGQRGQPNYTPEPMQQPADQQPRQTQSRQRGQPLPAQRPQQAQQTPREDRHTQRQNGQGPVGQSGGDEEREEPEGVTEADAQSVREKLGLEDDGESTEASA